MTLYTQILSRDSSSVYRRIIQGEPLLAICGITLLFLVVPLGLSYWIDQRTLLEINVWIKPLKFSVSLAVYTLSLSFFSHYVKSSWRTSFYYRSYIYVVIVAIGLEMIWLIFAAAIGEVSHFNNSHQILQRVYPVMGLLATVLTFQSLITGIGVLKNAESTLPVLLRYSIAYSLIATCILTLVTAYPLAGSEAQAHARLPDGATGLTIHLSSDVHSIPLLGWLSEVGDLRVAHFFSTHAMHFLPVFALLMLAGPQRTFVSKAKAAGLFCSVLTAIYSGFVAFVYYQASSGLPFIRL